MQIFMSFGLILSYHIHEPKEFPAFYCISTIVSSGPRPRELCEAPDIESSRTLYSVLTLADLVNKKHTKLHTRREQNYM